MSSVTSMSNASGLSVISVAQAKSQNLLDNFSSSEQARITSAPKSFIMTLSSSGFQAAIVGNAVNTDATPPIGEVNYAAYYTKYDGMSSDEWSSMLYAGGSVLSAPGETQSDTLQSLLTMHISSETGADAAGDQEALAAFHNKTLTIQKASDIAGLDWRETVAFSEGSGGQVSAEMGNVTYNQKFIDDNIHQSVGADNKHHATLGMGPTELYLSW